ncbi:TetR family transcriptional regulator [Mycobacteriaceae bacterium 1482268.1]|nr:TetR family transcriptional regulator [Mycobacteriaceae bacterium 1482268.1]
MSSSTAAKTVRDRLIDAAEVCLRAKGIRSTTVSEVAEVAQVSRGWLYRHFPDKVSLLGAAIVRLNETYWSEAHAMLERFGTLEEQMAAGVVNARTAYEDPGSVLMRLRIEEPEEFAACAGAGVQGLVPDLADFWRPYLVAAQERGEIHARADIAEASEWVARVLISLATVPGDTLDPGDEAQVRRHIRRYVMPGFRADPAS